MENTTEKNLVVFDEGEKMIADLNSASNSWTSFRAETPEQKAALFAVMNNPEKRISDCINMTLYIKDLYIESVQCTNPDTGEVKTCPRIVAIDKDGVGYQAVSMGVYGAFRKLIQIYGAPTWEKPIPIKVRQITRGARSMLTFDIDAKAAE